MRSPSSESDAQNAARRQVARLGKLLRLTRQGRYTVEELAARADVSSGLISQLERGQANPSFVSLAKIAHALNLPVGALLTAAWDGMDAHRRVVRRKERRKLVLEHGSLTYELLTPDLHRKLGVMLSRIPHGFDNREEPFQHPGEECLFVMDGALEVHVGEEAFSLEEGDALTYDSSILHWYRNASGMPAQVLGAATPPSF